MVRRSLVLLCTLLTIVVVAAQASELSRRQLSEKRKCRRGTQLQNGRCVRSGSSTCSDANCAECKHGGSYCVKCKDGYSARFSSSVGLLPCRPKSDAPNKCGRGEGLVDGDCKKCTVTGCSNCDGNTSKCSRCGHGYEQNGDSCKPLPADSKCADPNCARCKAPSVCEECAAGYWAATSVHAGLLKCRRRSD